MNSAFWHLRFDFLLQIYNEFSFWLHGLHSQKCPHDGLPKHAILSDASEFRGPQLRRCCWEGDFVPHKCMVSQVGGRETGKRMDKTSNSERRVGVQGPQIRRFCWEYDLAYTDAWFQAGVSTNQKRAGNAHMPTSYARRRKGSAQRPTGTARNVDNPYNQNKHDASADTNGWFGGAASEELAGG